MEETETGAAEDELAAEETENSDTEVAETEGTEAVEETEETETGTEAAETEEAELVETEVIETEAAETKELEVINEVRNATAAEDFSYEENDDGTITITKYTGSDTAVVIPETIEGKSVTRIGDSAFERRSGITSIELPSSLTSIGEFAFSRCSSLISIKIPAGVVNIGNSAFSYCASLTSIVVEKKNRYYNSGEDNDCIIETATNTLIAGCKNTVIPTGVTRIENLSFCGCSNLTSIEIPESVTSIGGWAFGECSGLTDIKLQSGLTSIGEYAFYGCTGLTSIEIPISVISIAGSAFEYCSGLTSIEIPTGITSIEGSTFLDCYSLTSVKIPSSVTNIGKRAFGYCGNLVSIEIPSSVTSIGEDAFRECSSLINIEIPTSVTSIENGAFWGCSSLTSIEIPSSVTSIGFRAFSDCGNLSSIVVEKENSVYNSGGGSNCVIETATNTLIAGCMNTIIPEGVTRIGFYAFQECSSLTSIEIPSSVTSIGDNAFYGCSGLTGIEIPSGVTSIGDDAFYRCDKLTIYCYEDSYAKQYAIDNDIPYSIIEEQTECSHTNTELRNAASATCTTAGYSGDTYCKDCGTLLAAGSMIPATGHTIVKDAAVAATCTTAGLTEGRHCPVCQTVIKAQETVPALGHSYTGKVTTATTVSAEGVMTYICDRCGDTYTEIIAKLTCTYAVKFDGNGANSGSMADQSMTYGSGSALNANAFQRKGYTFKGWNTKADGSGTTLADKADGSALTETDGAVVILYAKWSANKYTITFNGNGSTSGSMKKLTSLKYGKTYTLTKNSFKKKGYTFKGWNTKKDGSGKTYKNKAEIKNLSAKSGGKVTLYAKWSKTKYTITYNLNKGKNNKNNPSSYNITTKTIKLKNPTRKGYTFKGWYSDKKCTKKVTQIKKGSTGNVILYAKWAKKK